MIIDTNVNLSRWPFRRLALDETPKLVERLRRQNVVQAWAGSFEGLLNKDIGGVNARLAADCRANGRDLLTPFGSINPRLPNWQEDVRRCAEEHGMRGIRLHPNYHGYTLRDPLFVEVLRLTAARRLIVQLVISMEDARVQHPLMRVPPVDVSSLPAVLAGGPPVRLVVLNWWTALGGEPLKTFAAAGGVYFDISTVEGIEGIAHLTDRLPPERILFGSNAPFFNFEAALLKMQESGLPADTKTMLFAANAGRLLAR